MATEYRCKKYPQKWLCPPENDHLDCKDCIHSEPITKYKKNHGTKRDNHLV